MTMSITGNIILIVEDEPDLLDLFTMWLEYAGYNVVKAINGQAGLQQFIELEPDMVVTDLVMPAMNGLELCKQLRKISQVPILVVSALPENDGRSASLGAGANDYATKSISRADLIGRVGSLLSSSKQQQA